ncbi:MAG: GNAT family N-acetyltransferase [Gammaproteobacteria bacterium]|nr:GNAT family N-acetyltransferase [Gammaproteobacteria bacterium]
MIVRDIREDEAVELGRLMVDVYSALEGFPNPSEQPQYYELLENVATMAERPDTRVLVAVTDDGLLAGGVVYFADMSQYGSGGSATSVTNASGLRLLAVSPAFRGQGVGRRLTEACIALGREQRHAEVILHTTASMEPAWKMYERMGFRRSEDLDFHQGELPVFGFRLAL